ncbi:hypothetical protein CVD28_00675 [Bacillus sp. M6-12]|uniref:hypothetical protein n=1 Tax=Bacillus sp. M6-12 TaxID=2054166 RepID=UPI000C782F6F|nr:hypothetical protein [Bacillus sp. M6-12]PLS18947.1 hypothetical protein CVD28_00675 [Bacillus sp. M6-12]
MKKIGAILWLFISVVGIIYNYFLGKENPNDVVYGVTMLILIAQTVVIIIYLRMIYVANVKIKRIREERENK